MKKLALVLMTSILLTACAGSGTTASNDTATGIGGAIGSIFNGGSSSSGETGSGTRGITASLIKMYVDNQCVSNLQARQEWRLASLAMTAEKQAEWEGKICGCVSEEAPNQVTAADLASAMTEAGRTKLMTEITAKTVTACYKRLFTGMVTGK
ncbi:hypothetical protein [Simonsiella muelleri]|uniref:hypothetical protein n=1 Tax=Simonsiella muelleri TaxID=72 RepID=UPI0028D35688|nr:hypothetical protein [Simonsiella muelleri]